MPYTAKRYQMENGEVPFSVWMKKMRRKDPTAALKVDSRIARAMGGILETTNLKEMVSGNYVSIMALGIEFIIQSKMAK